MKRRKREKKTFLERTKTPERKKRWQDGKKVAAATRLSHTLSCSFVPIFQSAIVLICYPMVQTHNSYIKKKKVEEMTI